MVILSENEQNLCVKMPKKLVQKLHIEVMNKFGYAHGNTKECVIEAIKEWVDKSKKKRLQKERASELLKREEINADT